MAGVTVPRSFLATARISLSIELVVLPGICRALRRGSDLSVKKRTPPRMDGIKPANTIGKIQNLDPKTSQSAPNTIVIVSPEMNSSRALTRFAI